MLSEELDRQDFEAWFVPIYHPRHMNRNNDGDYLFIDAEIAWTAWKARSAELLSLREQLAELKVWATHRAAEDDARENDGYIELRIDYRQRQLKKILDGSSFTAAKPAEE
ncbi:hypothetical protein [Yersinia thracica]|uniref:hypothetical protein n=1 Tax=Yersinia thracica TaxID=2890319 RepID=UPI00157DA67C|nr:hypothetical protein [Yersinia thracica]